MAVENITFIYYSESFIGSFIILRYDPAINFPAIFMLLKAEFGMAVEVAAVEKLFISSTFSDVD